MLVNSYISYTQPSLVALAPTTLLYLSGRSTPSESTDSDFFPGEYFPGFRTARVTH